MKKLYFILACLSFIYMTSCVTPKYGVVSAIHYCKNPKYFDVVVTQGNYSSVKRLKRTDLEIGYMIEIIGRKATVISKKSRSYSPNVHTL